MDKIFADFYTRVSFQHYSRIDSLILRYGSL